MTYDDIIKYGKHIDIAFSKEDAQEIIDYADEWEIVDTRTAVWEFLDAYEGICHTRDLEFWGDREDD